MSHAETCSVCNGTGNTAKEPYPYEGTRQICHGCNGKGWVEVGDPTPVWPIQPSGLTTYPVYPIWPQITYTYPHDRGF
jgi:hypothetical protein